MAYLSAFQLDDGNPGSVAFCQSWVLVNISDRDLGPASNQRQQLLDELFAKVASGTAVNRKLGLVHTRFAAAIPLLSFARPPNVG